MSYAILYRDASAGDNPWSKLDEVRTLGMATDEVKSWRGPSLRRGDLVRVVGGRSDALYVFDDRSGSLVKAGRGSIASYWEGDEAEAAVMVRLSIGVDRRRVALAACDCAATTTGYAAASGGLPARCIELARARVVYPSGHDQATWLAATTDIRDARDGYEGYSAGWLTCDSVCFAMAAAQISCLTPGKFGEQELDFARVAGEAVRSSRWCGLIAAAGALGGTVIDVADSREDVVAVGRSMAPLIRRRVPLSVLACAAVGIRDPEPESSWLKP